MHSTDYAVILLGQDGRIEGWTGAAGRLFGYDASDVTGLDYSAIFVPEDVALGLHRQEMAVATASRRSENDRWHLRKDGSRFWGSGILQAVGFQDGQPTRYCKLLRDRSDVRTRTVRLENEVERLTAELRRRTESTAAVAHELRSPLAPLSAAAQVLTTIRDPEKQEKALAVLVRQIGSLTRGVEDLVDTAQASLGTGRLAFETVVVNHALEEAVEDARPAATAKRVSLGLTLPDEALTVEADPQRVQQMVQNLLSNAIKYTPSGGDVAVSVTAEADEVVIRVEDNGAGIDPDVLPRMFELFTREDRPDEQAWPSGMGVGLALVKTLAHLHRGTVEGRSLGRGQGSVFKVRLPMTQPPSAR